jgi:hypothetical protein
MKTAHATPQKNKNKTPAQSFSKKLEQEAGELEALHLGLRRHLAAWRNAHETTAMRLDAVMAHMDAVIARAERLRP